MKMPSNGKNNTFYIIIGHNHGIRIVWETKYDSNQHAK